MRRYVIGILAGLAWPALAWAGVQDSSVVVADDALPPVGAAYRGGDRHVFLDGHAVLTCSSHGNFTSSVHPPARLGASVTADHSASFLGELVLEPPLVPTRVVHPIVGQARMVERITLLERRRGSRILGTEMTTFDLRGAGMPAGVMVRESPVRESTGRTTIAALRDGAYRIDGYFDVWLEISLDAGRSWHPAAAAARMSIGPAPPDTRRLEPAGG